MTGPTTDHLANERTYLAWIRTGVTVMALGFVVARFALLVRELGGPSSVQSSPLSEGIGVFLVLAGAVLVVFAQLRFIRMRRAIDEGRFEPASGLTWALSGSLVLIGVALAVYLFATA